MILQDICLAGRLTIRPKLGLNYTWIRKRNIKKIKTLAGGCRFFSFLKFFRFPEICCTPDGILHFGKVCPESGESLP